MSVFMLIAGGLTAFLLGFGAGTLLPPQKRTQQVKTADRQRELSEELERLKTEYRNFLDYDGSEQV